MTLIQDQNEPRLCHNADVQSCGVRHQRRRGLAQSWRVCAVMQDFVIARQEEEMSGLKVQIGGLQQQLAVAADRAIDLTLRSSGHRLLLSNCT